MMPKRELRSVMYCKPVSIFLLISFTLFPPHFMADPPILLAENTPNQVYAGTLQGNLSSHHGASQGNPMETMGSLSLPEELGTIQEISMQGKEKPFVIYIQDAHTNFDAANEFVKREYRDGWKLSF